MDSFSQPIPRQDLTKTWSSQYWLITSSIPPTTRKYLWCTLNPIKNNIAIMCYLMGNGRQSYCDCGHQYQTKKILPTVNMLIRRRGHYKAPRMEIVRLVASGFRTVRIGNAKKQGLWTKSQLLKMSPIFGAWRAFAKRCIQCALTST